ncbi:uncharacterized protein LOC141652131 [Silene latifolia]|uniref:uncharacterized protein LOC141652131 n=1 Tax=Silene latifolia TaxID=37657 RepID=UPI003D77D592
MRKKTTARSPIKPAPKKRVKFVLEKGESSKGPDENVEVTEITWGVRGKRSSSSAQVRGPVVDVVDEQPVQTTTRKWKDIDAYGSPSGLQRLIGQLNEKQKDDIKEINFGGLLTLKLTQFYQGMVPFLLGAYHPKSRRFHVDDNKECFLTVYDVYDVFMLPCDTGKKVIVATNKKSDKHHMEYVQLWRDKFGLAPNKELSGEIVASEILKLKDGRDDFKRYFVLFVMGTVLAPKAYKNVDLHLVPSVKDVGEIGTFDWCAYVLEELGDAVSKWRSKDLKNVGGCMLFLQIVYFHRLTWQSLKASSEIPLIQHWDTKHLRTRVEEERKAAEEMKGRYGLGEWDTTTYPIGRERILVAKKEKNPIIELSQSGHGRTVTYRVPDDLLTNEEIRQQAKNSVR